MARMDALRDTLAAEYAATVLYASVHSADPGLDGSNEIAGVTREALTWNPGTPGQVVADQVIFDVPAGETVNYVGLWSALAAGTFLESVAVQPTDFPEAGNFIIADLSYTQD